MATQLSSRERYRAGRIWLHGAGVVGTLQGNIGWRRHFDSSGPGSLPGLAGNVRRSPQQESHEIGGLYMGLAMEAMRPLGQRVAGDSVGWVHPNFII